MQTIWLCVGMGAGLAAALCAWMLIGILQRPRVSIDNRIYYQPIEMRYSYCIKITNRSKKHCLYDLEFTSDLICAQTATAEENSEITATPLLQVLALPDACLRPTESRLYYLYLVPAQAMEEARAAETSQDSGMQALERKNGDFRSVFRKSRDAELQVLLKCKHGYSGKTRIFYKKFFKEDFYNHLKLEA